jgi:hypothetical protein
MLHWVMMPHETREPPLYQFVGRKFRRWVGNIFLAEQGFELASLVSWREIEA